MYFTDRGLEELADRRGEEQVTLAWLADQMQAFSRKVLAAQQIEFPSVEGMTTALQRITDQATDFDLLGPSRAKLAAARETAVGGVIDSIAAAQADAFSRIAEMTSLNTAIPSALDSTNLASLKRRHAQCLR